MTTKTEKLVGELLYAHHQWSLAKFVDNADREEVLAKRESFHEARQALINAADRTCTAVVKCSCCGYECSLCGAEGIIDGRYCWGCGARIVGDSDES